MADFYGSAVFDPVRPRQVEIETKAALIEGSFGLNLHLSRRLSVMLNQGVEPHCGFWPQNAVELKTHCIQRRCAQKYIGLNSLLKAWRQHIQTHTPSKIPTAQNASQ
ncbi:Hypothetical protein [Corynebacterium glutamicum ATCC 13032]|uniref:Uncharacterized protein n=1 Tax=Corynebacterium glutamicum (strain ATCC 13032 / DSM 20300 / JCM 1318 / BCRC 11384 / CCUG 27702 / LMG 3730 / NBRC 12168 / NCIMB 10025 / NRRL B-2784 / 534) TaxID=196627 RepID=Q8NRQ3_CORGL|nr:Hypothetical protein [Corynebacterium glutamicum ATCC 13032]